MTTDLNLPVEVVGGLTVRDRDGVALSSRNAYMSREERERARTIPAVLHEFASRWENGVRKPAELTAGLVERLEAGVDRIEYFGVYHPETLEELEGLEAPDCAPVAALAVYVGSTRLIDNIQVGVDPVPPG
jgi:pantoate--beta-alanine ligase